MESDLPDRTRAGSSLRHWPPGTNSKKFVPSFFVLETVPNSNHARSAIVFALPPESTYILAIPFEFPAGLK
jgi:hypothetical protein